MSAKPLVRPAGQLYDEDFALWTAEMARLLREGRFSEVDIEHVAEEVEDMGKRDGREMFSRVELIVQHLLKWEYQPKKRSRSWRRTVAAQQGRLKRVLADSPSLRRNLGASLEEIYGGAVRLASIDTGLPPDSFPARCPYTVEQILDPHFPPGAVT